MSMDFLQDRVWSLPAKQQFKLKGFVQLAVASDTASHPVRGSQ